MGAAKDQFLKDKEAAEKLRACTHADWFRKALMHARSEMMDVSDVTVDQLRGARSLEGILLGLGDHEEPPPIYPGPGLDHNLEVQPTELKPKETLKKA